MTEAQTEGSARARRYVIVGVAAFWGVVWWLVRGPGFPVLDALLLAVLLAAIPALSLAQLPLIRGVTIERLPAYWSSIVTLWLLGAACWLVGSRGEGVAAIGIVPIPIGPLLGWSVLLTVMGMGVIVAFRWLAARAGVTETPVLRDLLPRSGEERRVFALLSVAAGTGEELAYRGYSIPMLAPVFGLPGAAAVSTLVFGVMHAYQGWLGVVRTTVMGAILAWGFLASGSLIPAMIAHTAIDLIAGIVIADWLLSPEPDFGVEPAESTNT